MPDAPDNQPISEADLEKATNEAFADTLGGPQARALMSDPTPEPTPAPPSPTPAPAEPAPIPPAEPGSEPTPPAAPTPSGTGDFSDDEKALLNEIRSLQQIAGTPFKSTGDLVKGYKELQSTWTKEHEIVTRAKPYEQLLERVTKDQAFERYLTQVTEIYDNPRLAEQYASGAGIAPPNLQNYDAYDPASVDQYNKDMADYVQRSLDSRLDQRLAKQDAAERMNNEKAALKKVFPDADADKVIAQIQERAKKGFTLVDGYKVLEYDNLQSRVREEARKELSQKLEEAGKSTTPAASGGNKGSVSLNEILNHLERYGSDSTKKKYGERDYDEAMRASAELAMQ